MSGWSRVGIINVTNHTLVLGIGNTLLSDEGAGVHMLDYLKAHFPDLPGVEYLDGGTLSFTLAAWIEEAASLIVVDAAELQAVPGTVQVFRGDAMDRFAGKTKRSVHEVSLGDLLSIAHLTGTLPENRALIAIQPELVEWGYSLSDAVAKALPGAAQQAVDLIMQWQTGRSGQGTSELQTKHG
jgi:hydrogenase maturation protease